MANSINIHNFSLLLWKVCSLISKVSFHSIFLTNQDVFGIFLLDSALESKMVMKNHQISNDDCTTFIWRIQRIQTINILIKISKFIKIWYTSIFKNFLKKLHILKIAWLFWYLFNPKIESRKEFLKIFWLG